MAVLAPQWRGRSLRGDISSSWQASTGQNAGDQLASELGTAVYLDADLSQPAGAQDVADLCAATYGRLDLLVNNAAIGIPVPHADLQAVSADFFTRMLQVNLLGPWHLTRATESMLKRSGGLVINVSSVAGSRVSGSSIPYAVSKAGLEHMTRCLAVAMGPEVRVNAIAPGYIETERTRGLGRRSGPGGAARACGPPRHAAGCRRRGPDAHRRDLHHRGGPAGRRRAWACMSKATVCVADEAAPSSGWKNSGAGRWAAKVLVWDGSGPPPDGIEQTEVLLAPYRLEPMKPAELAAMPALDVIQLMSAGFEAWEPVVPADVALCAGRGLHGSSTAEVAVAGILMLLHQHPTLLRQQWAGIWKPQHRSSLEGSAALVVGPGDIGRKISAVLEVFGATADLVGRRAAARRRCIREVERAARLPGRHSARRSANRGNSRTG